MAGGPDSLKEYERPESPGFRNTAKMWYNYSNCTKQVRRDKIEISYVN